MSPTWYAAREPGERAAEVAQAFRDVHGHDPDGVWCAPGRVNLIGEHTDYNAGLCLPFALPQSTFVAATARTDGRVVLASEQRPDEPADLALDEIAAGNPPGWAAYAAGPVLMLRQAIGKADFPGLTAVLDSDVPVGAGLSSSAALSCSVVLAADELAGVGWAADDAGRARLVELCVRGENDIAGAPSGGMDQAAALRCTAGHALLLDCRDGSVRQVPFDVQAHGLEVLVVDTRAEHQHAGGEYAQRRSACERAAAALGVTSLREVADVPVGETLARLRAATPAEADELAPLVRHVVTEIERVHQVCRLLDDDRLAEIGPLLDASHTSLRDDYRVTVPELDLAVDSARAAGALGARMTGGGFGGSAIALVPADRVEAVAEAVAAAFAGRGWDAPAFAVAEPAAPGRRIS